MKGIPDQKDISGCAIAGIISESGQRFSGETIMRCMANMRERANGLGGGFAAYGIYPEHEDDYAIHLMCDDDDAKRRSEEVLLGACVIHADEPIPTRPVDAIRSAPILHRYFVSVRPDQQTTSPQQAENDLIVRLVMTINASVDGAFVMSSGKNMGIFKGVGYPEDIGTFFQLERYESHTWIGHGRFPTNTQGWWGGAHPFGLLDWAVAHNGEISSYGVNRRYLADFGYQCTLQTDTEVIAYLLDLLVRKHGLSIDAACTALAPPFWSHIERMEPSRRELVRAIRIVYGGALLNGPFSIVVGHSKGIMALCDRIKLRPMVAARKGDMLYVASEEAGIREVCRSPDTLWHAEGGVPIVGRLRASNKMPREPRCASGRMDARKGDDAVPGSGTVRSPDAADAGLRRNPEGRGHGSFC